MRRFMVHLVTEIDFVDGDEASDEAVRNYQKHVSETVRTRRKGSRSIDQGRPGRERLGRRNQNRALASRLLRRGEECCGPKAGEGDRCVETQTT